MVKWRFEDIPIDNPSFEGEYVNHNGNFVAAGWTPWRNTGNPPHEHNQGPCAAPEYKRLLKAEHPYRVVDGECSQCWFVRWKVFDAGLYQSVAVPGGISFVQVSVEGQAWSSKGDNEHVSDEELYLAVGIDPYGRTDPNELGVIWSAWWPMGSEFVEVTSPLVEPVNNPVTVFIRAWPKYGVSHNDVIVDKARLQSVTLECDGEPGAPAVVDYDRIENAIVRQLERLRLGLA